VRRQAGDPARELVHAVWQELQDFMAGQAPADDATLVVIKLL